ncbi:MAG: hypothetical protein H6617_10870 [Bdellovibrionaceae bacterium]|nr:hypothetical protein [Bdellovibrionales bacterium]MCB9255174.1 hypothetical protein [Pseudobdellovibrionaceae bacterium]
MLGLINSMKQVLAFVTVWFAIPIWASELRTADIQFQYISLTSERQFSCTHQKSEVGLYEWDVQCEVDGKAHNYFVHLALHFYPKTIHGTNAYELLYWVTDMTDPRNPKHDSSTIWIHNGSKENYMRVLEASQGIENDLAYLKLTVKLEAPSVLPNRSMP